MRIESRRKRARASEPCSILVRGAAWAPSCPSPARTFPRSRSDTRPLLGLVVGAVVLAAAASPPPAVGAQAALAVGAQAALAVGAQAALAVGAQAAPAGGAQAVSADAAASGNEIDRFMERALDNRDASWRRIGDFVLREVTTLAIDGPAGLPITGFRREYDWYVREDVVVRSPRRFDGVDIGETERREYEAEWLRRQRDRRDAERREESGRNAEEAAADTGGDAGPQERETADEARIEPEFISDAGYFMEFPFEPGNYYLAGYETLEGREVVKIEYYPTDLFDEDSEPDSERERRIAEGFAKTSLVTLWIDPEVHEVVRYTFDNVGLDFLPGRWLVRVDGWHASIEMAQPIGGVWLPRRMTLSGRATTALGAFELRLTREYSDYREALTGGRLVGAGDVSGDRR